MNLISLRAGPVSLAFDGESGALRYVFAGGHEVLRGINAPVRDSLWTTIRPEVSQLEIEQSADEFRVTFNVRCRSDTVDFRWRGTISGAANGTVAFDFDGEALREFVRNRIGFCVLHPAEAAGSALEVEHTDGRREAARLPEFISPHQPFLDIRALTHEFAPGQRAEVRLEGDTFEMEDQRNWTDASFKTYCTPLALPRPVTIPAGTHIRQRATIRLLDAVPAAPPTFMPVWMPPAEVELQIAGTSSTVLPALGTQWRGPPNPQTIAALSPLRLMHLRLDLWLGGDDWRETLRDGASAAASLETELELAVIIDDRSQPQLMALRDALAALTPAPRVARWLLFHERLPCTPAACIAEWRDVFTGTAFAADVGGGATDHFTELNRGREIATVADFTVHACNPQVHAFDDRTLIENLAMQAATVEAARRFSKGRPCVVSPVTLTPRCAMTPGESPGSIPAALRPFREDERLTSPFAAAWMLGSIAALSSAAVGSVTYFEVFGSNGLLGLDGAPRPVHRLLELIAPFGNASVYPVTIRPHAGVAALALTRDDRRVLIIAAFSRTPQQVRVTGTWGERELTVGQSPIVLSFPSPDSSPSVAPKAGGTFGPARLQ